MYLASPDDVREALGYEDMTNINLAIQAALDAAEPELSSLLTTGFRPATLSDTFYISQPSVQDVGAVETQMKLRRGFVQSITSIIVVSSPRDFTNAAMQTDITADVIDMCDLEKGVIKDYVTPYMRQYVRVTYAAGFPSDTLTPNPKSYDLTIVPDWLQEAAKTLTMALLNDQPSLTEVGIKLDTPVLRRTLSNILAPHLRYAPSATLPL